MPYRPGVVVFGILLVSVLPIGIINLAKVTFGQLDQADREERVQRVQRQIRECRKRCAASDLATDKVEFGLEPGSSFRCWCRVLP